MKKIYCLLLLIMQASCFGNSLAKDIVLWQEPAVKHYINEVATNYQFNANQLTELFKKTHYNPQVIELMNKPFEAKPWSTYAEHFITNKRIMKGKEFWQRNARALAQVSAEYGVPSEIIVAIIGMESNYGEHRGKYRVIDALSTLAFHYPKRAKFFRQELTNFLLLTRKEQLDPLNVYGSYAGAIGEGQFMPSSYRNYAIDFQHDGKADLATNTEDVIASVANYLKRNGWQAGQLIATRAVIHGDKYKSLLHNSKVKLTLKQLASQGITPATPIEDAKLHAIFLPLKSEGHNEYWLGFNNFSVIMRYNTSPLYAMSVHLLAQKIAAP